MSDDLENHHDFEVMHIVDGCIAMTTTTHGLNHLEALELALLCTAMFGDRPGPTIMKEEHYMESGRWNYIVEGIGKRRYYEVRP